MNRLDLPRILNLLTLVCAVLCVTGCATTEVRTHADFAAKMRDIRTINIVPPDVEFSYRTFNGENKRMRDMEVSIAGTLMDDLASHMKNNGYRINSAVSMVEHIGTPERRFQLEQLRAAYYKLSGQLYEHSATETEAKKFRLSVGPVVNQFAEGADAVFVIRYQGYQKSDGLQYKDMAADVLLMALMGVVPTGGYQPPPDEVGMMEIALIDGTTGDVLWSNRAARGMSKTDMMNHALTDFPKCAAPGAVTAATNKTKN